MHCVDDTLPFFDGLDIIYFVYCLLFYILYEWAIVSNPIEKESESGSRKST